MIKGLVQGVGFRPFIYRLAVKHGLLGEVDNRTNGVSVIVQGNLKSVEAFRRDILENAPPASSIRSIEVSKQKINGYDTFSISESKNFDDRITEISPDIAVCSECLEDMSKDHGRIDYPFVNCTNCGPRFTIVTGLPYDRSKTTMLKFSMCMKCASEYNNIFDRRFHAQPIACNSCGPKYLYKDSSGIITGIKHILEKVSTLIASGKSVAVKGLGGYNIICDALNNSAVEQLRAAKRRDAKPFAVMFRDISEIRKYCYTDDEEEKELMSWRRPVVILKQKISPAPSVSNDLSTTGAMLPYLPFHYMLFMKINTPAIIYTSGNISDEPIIIDDKSAEKYLMPVTGSLLSYNREIKNRADDSVIRIINGGKGFIRRSRGFVPESVELACNVEGIFAAGAEQKNSFCIGKDRQAIMSQYVGDLNNLPTWDFYIESIKSFRELFRFNPIMVACDLHPEYLSSMYAERIERELKIPLIRVQHHHAHIASCMAENNLDEKVIGVSLDGTGYGTDGNIWGGEFMIADLKGFERYTHFDYVPLPGGDKAIEMPWRTALAYLYKYFGDTIDYNSIPAFSQIEDHKLFIIKSMISKEINSPLSSGAGRLFDAVSALLGLCPEATFNSEAPMRLESVINCETSQYYPFSLGENISFSDTFREILKDLTVSSVSLISVKFHNTVAQIVLEVSDKIRIERGLNKVILSGGVFQNKYLLEKSFYLLREKGFDVYSNNIVPSNDGGISLGQLIIASKIRGLCA